MTPFKVITITNVNARESAGIGFNVLNQIASGLELTVTETKKDGGGTRWYNTEYGWINSNYVRQPNQIKRSKARATTMALADTVDTYATEPTPSTPSANSRSLISSVTDVVDTLSGAGINLGVLGSLGGITSNGSQDAILTRRIFGTPFQFLESADMRPDDGPLGLEFTTNIMSETPILSVLPGVPKYLKDLSATEKKQITELFIEKIDASTQAIEDLVSERLKDEDLETKFFEFDSAATEYMSYVDVLCRMCAVFLGIGEMTVPGTTEKYAEYNWFNWKLSNAYAGRSTQVTSVAGTYGDIAESAVDAVRDVLTGAVGDFEMIEGNGYASLQRSMNQIDRNSNSNAYIDQYYIDFFIKPPSYSESFSNQTTESAFASMLDSGSNLVKEFAFLTTAAGSSSANLQANMNTFLSQKAAELNMVADDGVIKRFMNRLLTGSATIISGGNLVFPNIWQSSSYNRDFNVEITLSTPYGDIESIFLEVFVPMMFLVALVLPRQATVNSYVTPFMVRANVPGFFTCDMGMVRDMQITRGGSNGDAWSVNGLPTEVTISMNIEDLYSSLSMSNFRSKKAIYNFLYNGALFDYIGNQCGLNMRSSEWKKKLDLLNTLVSNLPSDVIEYGSMYAAEGAATSVAKIMAAK